MYLTILGSGSSGNCYLVHNHSECLIIEAGVHRNKVMNALDYETGHISGCIVSHAHGDHAKYIEQYASMGIDVYSHAQVFEKKKRSHRFHEIVEKKPFEIGNFRIIAVPVEHDVPCFSFYIFHPRTGHFCFITDTASVPFTFSRLNHILIECNYSDEIIDNNDTHYAQRDRSKANHFSLDACDIFLQANDLSDVHNIVLLHLSDKNSHAAAFLERVRKNYNKNVFVAQKGLKIDFESTPF